MRNVIVLSLASIAVLSAAACSPSGEGDKPAGGSAKAPAAAPVATAMEAPKPGLWRISTEMKGMAGGAAVAPVETCLKEAKLETPQTPGQAAGVSCTTQPMKREGDAMVGGSVCEMPGGMKTESAIRVTGDFNSRYVTEVKTKMSPAPTPAMAETTMTMTAERIGDC
ncbi:hypothetical protein D3C86_1485470 [compost metagenome]